MNTVILLLVVFGLNSCDGDLFDDYLACWEREKPTKGTFHINDFDVVEIETDGGTIKVCWKCL